MRCASSRTKEFIWISYDKRHPVCHGAKGVFTCHKALAFFGCFR